MEEKKKKRKNRILAVVKETMVGYERGTGKSKLSWQPQ